MARPVPRALLLTEARPADVARLVREALVRRGARIDEQTHARTVFEDLVVAGGFSRGGYVGTYQAVGEKQVEVLVDVWATRPRQVFWGTVVLELLLIPVMFLASPPSAVFFLMALALWGWLAVAALLYYLSFRASNALEAELADDVRAALAGAGLQVLDEEQQLERRIRAKLEGEVKQRELEARPPPPRRGLLAKGEPAPAKERKPGLFGRRKA